MIKWAFAPRDQRGALAHSSECQRIPASFGGLGTWMICQS